MEGKSERVLKSEPPSRRRRPCLSRPLTACTHYAPSPPPPRLLKSYPGVVTSRAWTVADSAAALPFSSFLFPPLPFYISGHTTTLRKKAAVWWVRRASFFWTCFGPFQAFNRPRIKTLPDSFIPIAVPWAAFSPSFPSSGTPVRSDLHWSTSASNKKALKESRVALSLGGRGGPGPWVESRKVGGPLA